MMKSLSQVVCGVSADTQSIHALSYQSSPYLTLVFSYVGEVGIWTGIWALSSSALQTPHYPSGTTMFATISPLLTYYLLRYVSTFHGCLLYSLIMNGVQLSGVPPLERSGDKKFKGDPKWEEYKKSVPVFWPVIARRSNA